jgi:opacity protein-like surface antigen
MYPVTPQFNVYALLGWGGVSVDIDDQWSDFDENDGFSWGIGAEYAINENFSVFIDYTVIYDDDEEYTDIDVEGTGYLYTVENDLSVDTINFGVTYRF